mmetsp:Transcript_38928/g.121614  ORF Transcript_38928/g.121614 Transcript_38928/m.121614 type:complete len:548 (-) Transcript_38928:220-1863(-)
MEDDSPLLTPEAPLLTPEDAKQAPKEGRADAAANGVNGSKRDRPAEDEQAAPPPPPQAPSRCDSAAVSLGGFGATPSAEKYRKIEKVGVGAYGNVFMAENTETNQIVAIKATLRKEDPLLGGFPLSLLREIGILRRVRHESIVQIYEVAQTQSGDPLVVMEFCQASLLELIHSQKHDLSFSEIKYIVRQVLDAVGHLHSHGILHRDLATKNVLFNLSGEIKVCDFGISRMAFGEDEELGFVSARNLENPNQIVSLPYRAIELLLGDTHYGPALDVWAVGCILVEVLLCQSGRRQPFFSGDPESPNKTPQMLVEEIFDILGRPTDETWPGLSSLPLLKTYGSARVSSAKPHRERGEERVFLKGFFLSGEGKPANSKYCLTENCFDLSGALFTLCPAHRVSAKEALQHSFFTKEKPLPEWHAWHWALASSEIPRGDEMRRQSKQENGTRQLLKQLSRDEAKVSDDTAAKAPGSGGKAGGMLQSWRQEAEKRKLAEERKRAAERKVAEKRASALDDALPPGWTKHWSASKQRYYYHEGKTGKNLWSVPVR